LRRVDCENDVAATRPRSSGAKGEARSDLCGAAACGRGLMAKPST
jgi:hypothetical protein